MKIEKQRVCSGRRRGREIEREREEEEKREEEGGRGEMSEQVCVCPRIPSPQNILYTCMYA